MDFYGLIEKKEFNTLIKQAKKSCMKDTLDKLRNFNAMNEDFFKAAMPDDAPELLIKKRTGKPNKLLAMKREKQLKKILG